MKKVPTCKSVDLSIIITFCKQKQFVDDCLRSILMQKTRFSYEILIAVDGEDDGTIELLSKYQELYPFIHVWKVQSDARYLAMSRVSHNRLFLLEKARGDYFISLDGDDFFCSVHRFEEGLNFLLNCKDYIGHACEWAKYDHQRSSYVQGLEKRLPQKITKWSFIDSQLYIHASCFIFRNIFKIHHIKYEENDFFDDVCITQFMLKFGPVFFSGERQFGYRINVKSTFLSLPDRCRWLLQISTYTKIYDIVKHGMCNFYAIYYIKKILNEDNYDFPDNLKNSIIFQKRPLAMDIVRMNDMTDEERSSVKANLLFFCEYWERYRKEYLERKRKHSTEKSVR